MNISKNNDFSYQLPQNSFILKWENTTRKQTLKSTTTTNASLSTKPLTNKERNLLASVLTYQEILNSGEFIEDHQIRRKHKWKLMRNFYTITQNEPYCRCSIINALWTHDGTHVGVQYFVTRMMSEYQFELSMFYDKQLRSIYYSFEGGRKDLVDWREILASYTILSYFRLVKERYIELLLLLFDIYTTGDKKGRSIKKEYYYMENPCQYLRKIFLIPCVSEHEVGLMESYLVDFFYILKVSSQYIYIYIDIFIYR